MDIRDAYTHWSETYDQDHNLTRDLDQSVSRQLLSGSSYASILEIGCGTGKNTVWLAELGEQVLALDFSEGMLARARQKLGWYPWRPSYSTSRMRVRPTRRNTGRALTPPTVRRQ